MICMTFPDMYNDRLIFNLSRTRFSKKHKGKQNDEKDYKQDADDDVIHYWMPDTDHDATLSKSVSSYPLARVSLNSSLSLYCSIISLYFSALYFKNSILNKTFFK